VHMDMLAEKLNADPVEFRLRNLTDARMKRVVETAAQKFGWVSGARGRNGRGVGVSCATDSGAFAAAMAQVAVDRATGKVKVERIVLVVDVGLAINPDGMRQQMEGGVTMGLGYALTEEVRFRNGEVLDRNFDTYSLPLFSWLPKIETVLIDNPDAPATGGGEVPIINMGAVLANAIYNATGARLKQTPMTPERVKAAWKPA